MRKTKIIAALLLSTIALNIAGGAQAPLPVAAQKPAGVNQLQTTLNQVFLPSVVTGFPHTSPFGFEPGTLLELGEYYMDLAGGLGASWVRLVGLVAWADLQPQEGGPILWDKLAGFEAELRSYRAAGMTPIVAIQGAPLWAVIPNAREDGVPTTCAAIRADKFSYFASFLRELVKRYKAPEFNVHHWELGNEPELDPDFVPPNNGFGCWGDVNDPFYGGRHYGEMLKVVTPSIRAEDPQAKTWIGGLILPNPPVEGAVPGAESFMRGVLEAGAAPYFDIVPYHWYTSYWDFTTDYDLIENSPWTPWGGGTVGKAVYLRQLMGEYGVEKPVFLNETAMGCPNDWTRVPWCESPGEAFFQAQANYLVRSFTRGLASGIMGFSWYALQDPGWRFTGLVDDAGLPRLAYFAYKQMSQMLSQRTFVEQITYDDGVEAYAFQGSGNTIHVAWAKADTSEVISIPADLYIGAYSRDGLPLAADLEGEYYELVIGFEPAYIVLR